MYIDNETIFASYRYGQVKSQSYPLKLLSTQSIERKYTPFYHSITVQIELVLAPEWNQVTYCDQRDFNSFCVLIFFVRSFVSNGQFMFIIVSHLTPIKWEIDIAGGKMNSFHNCTNHIPVP